MRFGLKKIWQLRITPFFEIFGVPGLITTCSKDNDDLLHLIFYYFSLVIVLEWIWDSENY